MIQLVSLWLDAGSWVTDDLGEYGLLIRGDTTEENASSFPKTH